jgi:hypothetical protein
MARRKTQDAPLTADEIETIAGAYKGVLASRSPAKAFGADEKLQRDLGRVLDTLSSAASELGKEVAKSGKKRGKLRRKLGLLVIGGGLALAGSEPLRNKVLDALFGAEEEFQYSPPPAPAGDTPSAA